MDIIEIDSGDARGAGKKKAERKITNSVFPLARLWMGLLEDRSSTVALGFILVESAQLLVFAFNPLVCPYPYRSLDFPQTKAHS
jgi:hypothetical protein